MRTDYQPKPRVRPRPDHEKANGKVYSGKDKSMIALKKKGEIKKILKQVNTNGKSKRSIR